MTNTNLTTATTVTRQQIGRALAEARRTYATAPRALNAFNRAALELEASPWQWDGDTLRITSARQPSRRYFVTAAGCECKAGSHGVPCKHAAARALLVQASQLPAPVAKPATRPSPATPSRAQIEADELFN